MGPKIRAVVRFLEQGGKRAIITSPEHLARRSPASTAPTFAPEPGPRNLDEPGGRTGRR